MTQQVLSVSRLGNVVVLTLDSPPVNALSKALIKALHAAMDQVEGDASVGAVHIRSAAKVFCAGADLAEMRENLADPDKVDAQIDFVRDLQNVGWNWHWPAISGLPRWRPSWRCPRSIWG